MNSDDVSCDYTNSTITELFQISFVHIVDAFVDYGGLVRDN